MTKPKFEPMTVEELMDGLEASERRLSEISDEADEQMEERLCDAYEQAGGGKKGMAAAKAARRLMIN